MYASTGIQYQCWTIKWCHIDFFFTQVNEIAENKLTSIVIAHSHVRSRFLAPISTLRVYIPSLLDPSIEPETHTSKYDHQAWNWIQLYYKEDYQFQKLSSDLLWI